MKKKRICFVVSSVLTARFFLRFHIEKLSESYEVYLVGNFNDEDIKSLDGYKLTGIKSIRIERKINILNDIKSVFTFVSYIKKMNFDAIHSLAPKAGLISALAGKLSGTKNRIHIFTGQVWHTKKGFYKSFLKLFDRFIVFLNTEILVDGNSQREYLINEGIVKSENSLVLGNGSISGVDLKRFSPNKTIKEELRNKINIPENSIVFLFMGRINKDKGVLDLANAFKKLLKKYDNIFLLIVGYDEENLIPEIKNIVNDDMCFNYYGPTSFPEKLIQVGDVFCLPSYREGFGTSVIEASSCKLPTICSDTYGLRDTIIDKKTGLKHHVGDIEDLSNKMEILIDEPNLIKTYGKNAYQYVVNNFTAEIISKEWFNFYKRILN